MKKKIISTLLAATVFTSLIPCALAENVAEGKCGENATWTLDAAGTLTINGEGVVNVMDVSSRYRWTEYKDSIKKAVVENGITGLSEWTFDNCNVLTEVSLPDTLKSMDADTFNNCEALTNITIPATVETIGSQFSSGDYESAFDRCISLEAVNVSENNPNYKSVNGVLYDKNSTILFYYPEGKKDTSYDIPNGIEIIKDGAIDYVPALKSISIPATVTEIGYTFYGCEALETISVAEGNEYFTTDNNVLFSSDKTKIYRYPAAKQGNSYDIPQSVKEIGSYAFMGCNQLAQITIPDGVEKIDVSAFNKCISLTEITIPKSVTNMEWAIFMNCTSLKKAVIEANVNKIEDLFVDCYELENVVLPETVETIEGAFEDCTSLAEITLPSNLQTLDYSAFRGCTALAEITLPNTLEEIGDNTFYGCTGLTEVVMPDSVTHIGSNAFRKCENLKTVYLPNALKIIDGQAFNMTDLTYVYYDGTKTEWNSIDIATGNNELTRYAEIVTGSGDVELTGKVQIYCVAKPYMDGDLQYDSQAGTITVPLRATSLDCVLIAAAYNDNKLISINSKALEKEATSDIIPINADGSDKIVVYIWDSFNGITPMCDSTAVTIE